jgi:hypothetical protein
LRRGGYLFGVTGDGGGIRVNGQNHGSEGDLAWLKD